MQQRLGAPVGSLAALDETKVLPDKSLSFPLSLAPFCTAQSGIVSRGHVGVVGVLGA